MTMPTLASFGIKLPENVVAFKGTFEPTGIKDSNNQPYYKGELVSPVKVGCSVDKEFESEEVDELYVRKEHAVSDLWELVDANDPKKGYYIPSWEADFSPNQEIPIYQAESIDEWRRNQNKAAKAEKPSLAERLKARRDKLS